MQIIVICVVTFFAQRTIITHARLLQDTRASTKEDDQTNTVENALIKGNTQTIPLKDANPLGDTHNQTNPLEAIQTSPSAGSQTTILNTGETIPPGNISLAKINSTQKPDTSAVFNTTDKKTDQPYGANQTTILNGEGTSTLKKSVAKKENGHNERSTPEVAGHQNKVEFQTVSLLDKLKATTGDPKSTASAKAQQIDVNANGTKSRWGIFRKVANFYDRRGKIIRFTYFLLKLMNEFLDILRGQKGPVV